MRRLTSLSYSSLSKWETDPDTFYMERLAEVRIAREPQTMAAAIGSAFDAHVKSALAAGLFGGLAGGHLPESLHFEPLFESQVEEQNRFRARTDGQYAFDAYCKSGRFRELLSELELSPEAPLLELEASREIDGIPLMGKPDLKYKLSDRHSVIHDWKVKSFYSKHACSPTKGYVMCRDGWAFGEHLPSRSEGKSHKLLKAVQQCGVTFHDGCLSEFSADYADQLSIYSWVSGSPVGEPFLASIDELVCGPSGVDGRPKIRVSELRAIVSRDHQLTLLDRLRRCWAAITSRHVFTDLSLEESQIKQQMLENAAANMTGEEGMYYAKQGRKGWF